jgi:Zn ribbon nucleic-acid-binding protein
MRSRFNVNKTRCPRCDSPLWLVLTEYRFYIPHCVICGFEDYNRTTRQSGLSVEDSYKANTTETDTDTFEVA